MAHIGLFFPGLFKQTSDKKDHTLKSEKETLIQKINGEKSCPHNDESGTAKEGYSFNPLDLPRHDTEQQMYWGYLANLAEYAHQEANGAWEEEHQNDELFISEELDPYSGRIVRIKFIRSGWDNTFVRFTEDCLLFFFLGTVMATLSFLIDYFILICFQARMNLQEFIYDIHWPLRLFTWVNIPTMLVILSASFCQWLAPSVAGSGISEMKTMLRGVMRKEYLSGSILLAKIVGLTTALCASLPLGKEGPVMHMASIILTKLMNLLRMTKGTEDNVALSTDLLATACAVGMAVCYAAPIGGMLFSLEVTAVYFTVRSYWCGLFASAMGAMFYRFLSTWYMKQDRIFPIYKVENNFAYPYDMIELLPFLYIGVACGFLGSLFVYFHWHCVLFVDQNKILKSLQNERRLLYSALVAIIISISTFPDVLGHFMASRITGSQQILDLFSNTTWTVHEGENATFEQSQILKHWAPYPDTSFHYSLAIFQIVTVIEIAVASTLPVPIGFLMPLLKVGASFGRQIGEMMVTFYPMGIKIGFPINPGAYAMIGAASFCAATTHTISIAVIIFELTGQITYVIPIMIGVLVSNCISSLLQPSIYDNVIRIKKVPYLPGIITTTSGVDEVEVENIICD